MTDSVTLNFTQFQKKNYEKDLLDQEKEREELLFLEMVCCFPQTQAFLVSISWALLVNLKLIYFSFMLFHIS